MIPETPIFPQMADQCRECNRLRDENAKLKGQLNDLVSRADEVVATVRQLLTPDEPGRSEGK
jgi:hypothetical protein